MEFIPPKLRRLGRALSGPPQHEQSIQQRLVQAERNERLAQALLASGHEGVPAEWSQMRMMPKYTAEHGVVKLGQALLGSHKQRMADEERERVSRELQGVGQEIGRAAGLGGTNPQNIAASEFNRANPGELQMVETSPQMQPGQLDRAQLMQMMTTQEGQMALRQNPVLAQFAAQQLQPEEAYTLGPGERRLRGNQVIAEVPKESETPRSKIGAVDVSEFEPQSVQDFSSSGDYSRLRRREGGESLKDRLGTEEGLRKELTTASKDYRELAQRFSTIKSAAANPSPAADLSMIFGYMKMLDPTSVVREGEQASASNAAGVPDLVRNYYNRILEGAKLTPEQRSDFLKNAQNIYETRSAEQQKIIGQYTDIAQRAGVDVRNVVLDAFRPQERQTSTQAPAQAIEFLRANPQTAPQFRAKYGYLPEGM